MNINGSSPVSSIARLLGTTPAHSIKATQAAGLERAAAAKARSAPGLATAPGLTTAPGLATAPGLTTAAAAHEAKAGEKAPPASPHARQIAALTAAWDTDNKSFDLDGDGTVGPSDLAQLLASLSGDDADDAVSTGSATELASAQPAGAEEINATQASDAPKTKLDALLADWGKTGSQFDLDGDGTVGASDLAQVLAQMAAEAQAAPPSDTAAANSTEPALDSQNAPELGGADGTLPVKPLVVTESLQQPASPIDQLLSQWGQSSEQFDFDKDGTVGPNDLAQLLSQLAGAATTNAAGPASATLQASAANSAQAPLPVNEQPVLVENAPARRTRERQRDDEHGRTESVGDRRISKRLMHKLEKLADRLVRTLEKSGFDQSPPTNIRQVVSSLGLSEPQQKLMLNLLARRYPDGLGVNEVA
jgi:Ca2+-binding EF-hand superfamily protein